MSIIELDPGIYIVKMSELDSESITTMQKSVSLSQSSDVNPKAVTEVQHYHYHYKFTSYQLICIPYPSDGICFTLLDILERLLNLHQGRTIEEILPMAYILKVEELHRCTLLLPLILVDLTVTSDSGSIQNLIILSQYYQYRHIVRDILQPQITLPPYKAAI